MTCVLSLCHPVCHPLSPPCHHQPFRGARTRNPLRLYPPPSCVACGSRVVPRCAALRTTGKTGRKCLLYFLYTPAYSRLCTKSRSFIELFGIKKGLFGREKAFTMRPKRSY